MLYIFDLFAVAITFVPICIAIKRVLDGKYSVLHICAIVFWLMQVLPLAVEIIFGISDTMKWYSNMYYAMNDEKVGIIYDVFVIFSVFSLYAMGNRYAKKRTGIKQNKVLFVNSKSGALFHCLLWICMFSPIVAVLLSPSPSIYLNFSYFYTHDYSILSQEYQYHIQVITFVNYLAFGATMLCYYYKSETKYRFSFDVFLAFFFYSWIDGKRALLLFSLIGIIAIDVLKKRYINRKKTLLAKAIAYVLFGVIYFAVYSAVTYKNAAMDPLMQYTLYFNRLNSVKTSIYDAIHHKTMLDYSGQTLLFNLLFFVPRSIWPNKPVMFCKYFTAYAIGLENGFSSWNFQVNIWSEFVANLGIVGFFFALLAVLFIARITEKSDSVFVNLFGTIFLVFYFVFGFETLTSIAYVVWLMGVIGSSFSKKIRFVY